MTESAFEVARLDGMKGQPVGGRARLDVRRELGIRAFGTAAFRLLEPGDVIRDHEEASLRVGQSGQEELYVVVAGRATFEVDGERVEAPQGTLVFIRDPGARRRAVAEEPGTTVLVIGGKPGEAFYPLPAEAYEASAAYNAGHFERRSSSTRACSAPAYRARPSSSFNLACCESLLGRTDAALERLRAAVEADERVRELAQTDIDFDSIRADARFAAVIA